MKVCKCVCVTVTSITWSSALHNLVGLRLSDLRRLARPSVLGPMYPLPIHDHDPLTISPASSFVLFRSHTQQLHFTCQKHTSNQTQQCVCICVYTENKSFHYICEDFWCVTQIQTHTDIHKKEHCHMIVVKLSLTPQIFNYTQDLVYIPCKYRVL